MNVLLKIIEKEKNKFETLKTYQDYLFETFIEKPIVMYPSFTHSHATAYRRDAVLAAYLKSFGTEELKPYQIDFIRNILGLDNECS